MSANQCEQRTRVGRCRNKAVAKVPSKHSWVEPMNVCRKHAHAWANTIVQENARLVWALRWQAGETP